jgi:hypothetical protein
MIAAPGLVLGSQMAYRIPHTTHSQLLDIVTVMRYSAWPVAAHVRVVATLEGRDHVLKVNEICFLLKNGLLDNNYWRIE